jgi:hypothetical protein
MMPAIFYLSNVIPANKKWKEPAARNAWILFICLLMNRRNSAPELIRVEMFLINRGREGLRRGRG